VNAPILGKWATVDTTNGKAKVWFNPSSPAATDQAKATAGWIDEIWSKYSQLWGLEPPSDNGASKWCRGGDDKYDIIIKEGVGNYTSPYGYSCSATASYMLLRQTLARGTPQDLQHLRGTLAHELMHAFQMASKNQNSCNDSRWLMDATADWARDFAWSGDDGEHSSMARFQAHPEVALDTLTADQREYGGALFFMYVARTYGDKTIPRIYANLATNAPLKAVDMGLPGASVSNGPNSL
jgi:hypothetical protein